MTAKNIIDLLDARHKDDLFVPECKSGPTQLTNHVRLDAWAFRKSWAHPCMTGYEVKVSRSDFLGDNKMAAYLPLCNALYVVCPHGLIQPEEVLEQAGLLWVTSTGTRLVTKKKAPYREIAFPEQLVQYVLMCRARILRYDRDQDRTKYWKNWLLEKEENQINGHAVSRRIDKLAKRKIAEVERENKRLKERQGHYDKVQDAFSRAGFDIDRLQAWNVDRQIQDARKLLTADLHNAAVSAQKQLERIIELSKQPEEA